MADSNCQHMLNTFSTLATGMYNTLLFKGIIYSLLLLHLISCNHLNATTPEARDTSVRTPILTSVSEKSTPPTPKFTGDEITCTYFVSPFGDDASSGSESQPWGSFQYAVDSVRPGDTVCFREGNYVVEDSVHISGSGTPDASIAFIAYPGEIPILDGNANVGDLLIFDQYASYIRLSGITLRNFLSWGVDLNGENRNINLDHLTIEGGEAGIHFTYGDDDQAPPEAGPVEHITLEDSLVIDSQYTGVDCTPGPCNNMIFRQLEVFGSGLSGESSFGSDGIAISRGFPVLVEDCYIHDNGGDGIDLNSRDREGHAAGVIVRRNKVVRNRQNGIKLWAGGRLENNLVWGQGNSAIWIGTFHSNLEVVNNTIAYNMWDPTYSGRNWAFSAGYPEEIIPLPQVDLLLVNNIFAFNTGPEVGDPTGIYLGPGVKITEHNNLYFSSPDNEITAEFLETEFARQELTDGTWMDRTGQGQMDLTVDPLFISGWPQVNLSFQPASPAIDAGDNTSCPEDDYDGNHRPLDGDNDGDAICDMGAIEWKE